MLSGFIREFTYCRLSIGSTTFWLKRMLFLLVIAAANAELLEEAASPDDLLDLILWQLLVSWPKLPQTAKLLHDSDTLG